MATETDFKWFELKKYDGVRGLDLTGWHAQLKVRSELNVIATKYNNLENIDDTALREHVQSQIQLIKQNPILTISASTETETWVSDENDCPFNTYSVQSLPAFIPQWETFEDFPEVLKACESTRGDNATLEERKIAAKPYNYYLRERGFEYDAGFTFLVVNLEATNDQILNDFKRWLISYRKEMNYHAPEKNFSDKNVAEWCNAGVLPYLDLTIIAKLEGKAINQSVLAALIMHNQELDAPADKVRRTTKKLAEPLLNYQMLAAMAAQIPD